MEDKILETLPSMERCSIGQAINAIMVGNGSDAFNGKRDSQSNYGQRVDVQANGQSVVTSGGDREGYGDLFPKSKKLSSNPAYTNVLFTGHFGGTSGAGAIVAGVAASLQSIWLERGNLPLLPACIRKILVETGTPQDKNGDQTQHIGPRPNLRAAINQGLMNDDDDQSPNTCDCAPNDPNVDPRAIEVCDGIDNNCNEQIDETFDVGVACSVGIGACQRDGNKVCTPDRLGTQCDVTPGLPTTELCGDGIDNDCDGQIDEDCVSGDFTLAGTRTVIIALRPNVGVRPSNSTLITVISSGGFSQNVILTASGLPSNIDSQAFDPPVTLTPSQYSTGVSFRVVVSPSTPLGDFSITITGKDETTGTITNTHMVRLQVVDPTTSNP